jgi:hypothetical protein
MGEVGTEATRAGDKALPGGSPPMPRSSGEASVEEAVDEEEEAVVGVPTPAPSAPRPSLLPPCSARPRPPPRMEGRGGKEPGGGASLSPTPPLLLPLLPLLPVVVVALAVVAVAVEVAVAPPAQKAAASGVADASWRKKALPVRKAAEKGWEAPVVVAGGAVVVVVALKHWPSKSTSVGMVV